MTVPEKWKERCEKVAIPVVANLLVLLITSIVKGELTALVRLDGLARLLRTGVPLWLCLIGISVAAITLTPRWTKLRLQHSGKLHVVWQPQQCRWGIGGVAGRPAMQLYLAGIFTNSDLNVQLIVTQVYLEGTKAAYGLIEPLAIPPHTTLTAHIHTFVEPVIAEKGKPYHGRLILIDQFTRKYSAPVDLNFM